MIAGTPEKCARLTALHHTVHLQKKALERLVNAVDERIQKKGLRLEEPIHNDLVDITKQKHLGCKKSANKGGQVTKPIVKNML